MIDWLYSFREGIKQLKRENERLREGTNQLKRENERLREGTNQLKRENEALRSITPEKIAEIVNKSMRKDT